MIRGASVRLAAGSVAGRRFVSTANAQTKYATLSNGVTVATESNPHATTATVGVWFGAGSRLEHAYSNGVSALTASVLASGVQNGVLLTADASRETTGIVAESTNENAVAAAQALAELVSAPEAAVEKADFARAKDALVARAAANETDPNTRVWEHLNASAFQGYSLGLPVLGTEESVRALEQQDSVRALETGLVGSNTVVAAAGNIDHDKLVDTLEASLKLKQGLKPATKPASFLGSEVRMRDDTMPKAYIAIAAQGEAVSSPAYYVAKVASAVFGNFDHAAAHSRFTSPKLASIVQDYHIVDKYSHFSQSYSDTGLWGVQAEISNISSIDEFAHFTLKEWNRLLVSVTDAEVARAKAAVKTALLGELNSSRAIASDIASKVLLVGYRNSLKEALDRIDAVATKDVKAWAQAALWDKDIVVSGTGQIEGLLDYNRMRNDMSMMRW